MVSRLRGIGRWTPVGAWGLRKEGPLRGLKAETWLPKAVMVDVGDLRNESNGLALSRTLNPLLLSMLSL